jgi:hypothetical protein
MQGTQADSLTTSDYAAFSGSSFGNIATWEINTYNEIVFNSTGISAVQSGLGGVIKICAREYDHDYSNVDIGTTDYYNGCYYADDTSGTKDPYLYITITTAGHPTIKRFGGIPYAALNRGVW